MRWRRKQSVTNPRQQIWFGLEVVAIALGFVLLCAFVLFIPPMSDLIATDTPSEQVLEVFITFVLQKWIMVLLAMLILFVMGVLMAHRLYGPLFGLDKALRSWMAGDRKARVYFRKYDFLLPAKEVMNQFLSKEEDRLKRIEEVATAMKAEEILKIVRE